MITSRWWAKGAVLAACLLVPVKPALAKSERYTFIISDTHFGVGRDSRGAWDAYEDARWPEDLATFLTHIATIGEGKADLVINGDVFELWQSRQVPCNYANKDAGCSEDDALRRFKAAVAAHSAEIKALKAFASNKDNTLTFVVGNHDVALLLPSVKQELNQTFAGCKFAFGESGVWQSGDGKVRAEHGHQIGEDLNAFAGWPRPFIKLDGRTHVRRPWGEQFVQDFYNQFESKYPVIDNITDELKAMRFGLKAEGIQGSMQGSMEFLKFLALHESWTQATQVLGGEGGGASAWDIEKERSKGRAFLQESFPTGDVAVQVLQTVSTSDADAFVRDRARLSDADIRAICDARFSKKAAGSKVVPCARPAMGNLVNSVLTKRVATFRAYLDGMHRVPRVFVFSHTHLAERFSVTNPDVTVINTGAWQRLISPEQIEARALAKKQKVQDLLRKLVPEDLDACYSFVAIPPYKTEPQADLLSWRLDKQHPAGESSSKPCN